MKLRTLRASERERVLDLLDAWDVGDGWRGRDFFRRYVEQDESFADENLHVAEDAGRLVACVQIFSRVARVRGAAVPLGGIGSVYTDPGHRGRGIARALLGRGLDAMRARGMELSLLFAGPVPLYASLGWRSWGSRSVFRREPEAAAGADASAATGIEHARFDPARDLAAVVAIHRSYSASLDGTLLRDAAAWRTSLRVAGNPREEFFVARRGGRILAYVRSTGLQGYFFLIEYGRVESAHDALAELIAARMAAQADDPLAPPGRSSAAFRALAVGGAVSEPAADPELVRALEARGVERIRIDDPGTMLRCLDAPALARRLDVPLGPDEDEEDEDGERLLRRVLPPERFHFWPADRF